MVLEVTVQKHISEKLTVGTDTWVYVYNTIFDLVIFYLTQLFRPHVRENRRQPKVTVECKFYFVIKWNSFMMMAKIILFRN